MGGWTLRLQVQRSGGLADATPGALDRLYIRLLCMWVHNAVGVSYRVNSAWLDVYKA